MRWLPRWRRLRRLSRLRRVPWLRRFRVRWMSRLRRRLRLRRLRVRWRLVRWLRRLRGLRDWRGLLWLLGSVPFVLSPTISAVVTVGGSLSV
jgi:hypothetical protein